ncbi:MAG TPA: fibronectin type III domain-containing protein [Kofleriaceae bacterium]|nr:fibronectin type III domain-containing protein [Kofleriaceae bacterium]
MKSLIRLFVVVGVCSGLSACGALNLSSGEQNAVAPDTVTATAVTDTEISVSWTSAPGAFKYFVFQSTAGGPFNFIGTVLEPSTSLLSTGLTPSTTYAYQIVTVDTGGAESAPSAPVSATTLAVDPNIPTNITATAVSSFEIDLSWSTVTDAAKYYVFESAAGGPFNFIATVLAPGTTFQATGLTANTNYCFELASGLNDGETTAVSAPVCTTTSAAATGPNGLIVTAVSDTRIFVQWQPVTGAAKYFVYQAADGDTTFTPVGAVIGDTTFLAANLTPSTEYCYRVTTVDAAGTESAPSATVCDKTLAPGGGGFLGYWKLDERSGTAAIDSSGFGRTGAIGDATYSLQDRPNIDDDRSALSFSSSPDSAITVPASTDLDLLGNFTVAFWANLPAAADVDFIGMRAAGCGTLGWEIAQDSTSGLHFAGPTQVVSAGTSIAPGTWTHVAVTSDSTTLTIFVNGVQVASAPFTPDNTLTAPLGIGHVAGCAGGAVMMDEVQILNRAMSSAEIAAIGALPPAPANLVVSSKTSASLTLSWTPVPGAVSYIISKGTAAGNEAFFTHSPASPATFVGEHLAPATQSSWTVRAVVGKLFSNPSNEVVDSTNGPPAAPTNVTATVVAPDRIQVQWTAAPDAVKYFVFMSTNGGPFVGTGAVLAPDTSFLAVNLAAGTSYAFQVQSEDVAQTDGPMSAPVSATTP